MTTDAEKGVGGLLERAFARAPQEALIITRLAGWHAGLGRVVLEAEAFDWTCTAAVGQFSQFGYGLAPVAAGSERLMVRVSEIVHVTDPCLGDYLRRDEVTRMIVAARKDPSGTFWVFQCERCPAVGFPPPQYAAGAGGGDVDPSDPPIVEGATYYNRTDKTFWVWDAGAAGWVKLVDLP